MRTRVIATLGVLVVLVTAAGVVRRSGAAALFAANRECCQLSLARNLRATFAEATGRTHYFSEIGQDKWVLEKVFPGVTDGYFMDIGSGHGTIGSNSRTLEARGWKGTCVDPFPVHMEGRTCTMLRAVVFSKPGQVMEFHTAGGLSGLGGTLGDWNVEAARAPTVKVTTVTLDEVLTRAGAPPFIHFISLDIEGAELEALRAFPFDRYRVGAWAIEHNREEPKRSGIVALLARHGYRRAHEWRQDDFFVPADAPE